MVLARWQQTIVDEAGDIQNGATVTVRSEAAGSPLALLYSDRDGTTSAGNPVTADSEGFAAFYAAGGAYRITATKGAFSQTWRYVGIGTAQEYDQADVTALVQQVDAGYALKFEAETSAPPSAGAIRFDNADLSAATEAYVSTENLGGSNIELRLLELYSASRTIKDTFAIADPANNEQASWQIDGAALVGSPGDYVTLTISAHAGETSFTDNEPVNFQANRAGVDGGSVSGPGSSVDGHAVLFDGTSGAIIKSAGAAPHLAGGTDVPIGDGGTGQSTASAAFGALKQAATRSATGVVEEATEAEVRAATNAKFLDAGHLSSAVEPVTLSDGATISLDWTAGINFEVTLGGNRELQISNGIPGQWRTLTVFQDSNGSRTLTIEPVGSPAVVEYVGGSAPTLTTAGGAKDRLNIYCAAEDTYEVYSALDIKGA